MEKPPSIGHGGGRAGSRRQGPRSRLARAPPPRAPRGPAAAAGTGSDFQPGPRAPLCAACPPSHRGRRHRGAPDQPCQPRQLQTTWPARVEARRGGAIAARRWRLLSVDWSRGPAPPRRAPELLPLRSMSSDPPPPYPGGPSAPLLEEKDGFPFPTGRSPPAMVQPPSDVGPPPYEAMPPPQPGFIPPPVPAESSMPYYPPGGYYVPPAAHAPMGCYPPTGPYTPAGGQTATVLVPSGTATTVTVLQGEIFQAAPVPTVCPHCQQAITTKISHEIGLMNFFLGFFCCFIGCDLGCCFIPCLIDEFKDVTHTCPNCKAYIYTYKRMC